MILSKRKDKTGREKHSNKNNCNASAFILFELSLSLAIIMIIVIIIVRKKWTFFLGIFEKRKKVSCIFSVQTGEVTGDFEKKGNYLFFWVSRWSSTNYEK